MIWLERAWIVSKYDGMQHDDNAWQTLNGLCNEGEGRQ